MLAGVQRRSREGWREEHWHCRGQAAAGEHLAGAAWPPAGAGWAAGDAEQVAGGEIPWQPAADAAVGEKLSGAGLQNGRLPEQGLEVELQQEPVTVRLSIGKRCKCFKLIKEGGWNCGDGTTRRTRTFYQIP